MAVEIVDRPIGSGERSSALNKQAPAERCCLVVVTPASSIHAVASQVLRRNFTLNSLFNLSKGQYVKTRSAEEFQRRVAELTLSRQTQVINANQDMAHGMRQGLKQRL